MVHNRSCHRRIGRRQGRSQRHVRHNAHRVDSPQHLGILRGLVTRVVSLEGLRVHMLANRLTRLLVRIKRAIRRNSRLLRRRITRRYRRRTRRRNRRRRQRRQHRQAFPTVLSRQRRRQLRHRHSRRQSSSISRRMFSFTPTTPTRDGPRGNCNSM